MGALSWETIAANALAFSAKWRDAQSEKADSQTFLGDFLKVFGVNDPRAVGGFEVPINLDDGHSGYIDYFWPKKIAIEMKSPGKDLKKAYEQLKNYVIHLPATDMPELLLVCDFQSFQLHHRPSGRTAAFKLKDLRKRIREFASLAGYEISREPAEQIRVNVDAAQKMAKLHDALLEYGYSGHCLELYLARLLFCLFAEDTNIFPPGAFLDYIANSREDGSDLASRLELLFEALDMPPEERKKRKRLSPTLLQFQYINGQLFAEILPHADFDAHMRGLLLECAEFDWSAISPAVFGSIFQGVMDRRRRRELGAHYTSEENILKLINPLFMDDLWEEFEKIKGNPGRLSQFHNKIASLKFLDPACGCGNFLIIAYRELRRLELAILKLLMERSQAKLTLESFLKVGVGQFCGLEIEEFPARIAQVGMWLMDHQMNMEAGAEFGGYYARLPLEQSAAIMNIDALEVDWLEAIPGGNVDYIIGNPPFSGARLMKKEQKRQVLQLFAGQKNAGDLDYVACWLLKANELMKRLPHVKTAFVATNSIVQGMAPSLLWKAILESGAAIRFAHKTFKWQSEARGKAAVHCVIAGFDRQKGGKRLIYDGENRTAASNINAYLADAESICVESRQKPLWNAPEIGIGNKPIDGGNYLFTPEEKEKFLQKESGAAKYMWKWLGAEEFLNNKPRYCLWLGDCPPGELASLPECLKVVNAVKNYREHSPSPPTKKLALTPTRFHVENMPDGEYLVIPKTSSETRHYVPIGFEGPDTLCGDALFLLPGATLYHFGILASSCHNAWIRAVAGRLEMRYRYSKDIVYNNFPWPEANARAKDKVASLAQAVLDARAEFPGSALADLYNPLTMPARLLKAHQKLDQAVLRLYGLASSAAENEIIAHLLRLYRDKTKQQGELIGDEKTERKKRRRGNA